MEEKTVNFSRTVMSQIMLPSHANPSGNVHGGEIIKLMDNAAYVVAKKHANANIVTARVDELQFHLPVFVANLITCKAELIFVGKSSMEINVKVEVEDLEIDTGPNTALTAFFTMVALDKHRKPVTVPRLILETESEKEAFVRGQERYQKYKKSRSSQDSRVI